MFMYLSLLLGGLTLGFASIEQMGDCKVAAQTR